MDPQSGQAVYLVRIRPVVAELVVEEHTNRGGWLVEGGWVIGGGVQLCACSCNNQCIIGLLVVQHLSAVHYWPICGSSRST